MYYDIQTDHLTNYALESFSKDDSLNNIKSIKDFSSWMKSNIHYSDYTHLMSAEEVYKNRRGSCHDQVIFEKSIFRKLFKNYKTGTIFFIEYNDDESTNAKTHSLLYYFHNNMIFWLENAWGDQQGIHGPFKSVKELKECIVKIHEKESSYKRYPKLEFTTVKNVKHGMDLGEFVSKCLNN